VQVQDERDAVGRLHGLQQAAGNLFQSGAIDHGPRIQGPL